MQDLKALEGKSLAELREIGKALGIPHLMMKKKDLIEKILNFTQDGLSLIHISEPTRH